MKANSCCLWCFPVLNNLVNTAEAKQNVFRPLICTYVSAWKCVSHRVNGGRLRKRQLAKWMWDSWVGVRQLLSINVCVFPCVIVSKGFLFVFFLTFSFALERPRYWEPWQETRECQSHFGKKTHLLYTHSLFTDCRGRRMYLLRIRGEDRINRKPCWLCDRVEFKSFSAASESRCETNCNWEILLLVNKPGVTLVSFSSFLLFSPPCSRSCKSVEKERRTDCLKKKLR